MLRVVRGAGLLRVGVLSALAWFVGPAVASAADPAGQSADRESARRILEATGIQGGLVVHLGCGDGRLTAALGAGDRYLVHGLEPDADRVRQARRLIQSLGLYGKVSVEHWTGRRLPYTDNLVNLLVSEDPGEVPAAEVLRVLCPGGVAYVREGDAWKKTVKRRPKEIDEWTHYLHGPDGNAVARDSVVGPPHHIQWVGQPRRARHHERLGSISVVVSAGGRVFSIQDEGSVASIVLPARWFLVARDAFNGVILWKRPVGPWEGHLEGFRSGPPQVSRRLVAAGNRVYVTLGYGKPLCALDAATGETVKTYERTAGTAEILHHDGVLFLVAGDAGAEEAARRRGAQPPTGNRRILVIQAETGNLLWEKSDADTAGLMPTTLATGGGRVFFQNPKEVLCLDAKTGKETWRADRPVSVTRPGFSAPTLVVYGDVVFSADRAAPGQVQREPGRKHKTSWCDAPLGELVAFSAKTGERLWSCPCRECFNAPVDVLVADGLVWTGELVVAGEPGITAGRDPVTGQIKRRRPADQEFFQVGMPHHRCHRNRATDRYLVLGRAGVEFIDLATGRAIPNHWVRGTCQHGIVPCNGLLYAPPHSCACYSQAKLNGFYALAPEREPKPAGQTARDEDRLQKGPACGSPIPRPSPPAPRPSDWPTYRHDEARSGCTDGAVPTALRRAWGADLGGRLSSVTVAGGRLLVASIDTHTVYCLDAEDGRVLWQFTAGGRVDSPPTMYKGLALFGSADGWVYCLRVADGQLAWRFRAAPEDRRVVAYGQLESAWPVHGSVLVQDGVAQLAAGRSSYLDGGIYLVRLDPRTGRKLSETCVDSRDPKTGRQPKGVVQMFDLPGALPDVLSSDGSFVYMRHMKFDRQGTQQKEGGVHLFSPTGLLDDSWWHRSYWILGTRFYTGYRDWFRAGREVPAGRLLVFDRSRVYGFGRKPEYYYWSSALKYHLFATDKQPEIVEAAKKRPGLPAWGKQQIRYRWSEEIPLQVRAMVLAAGTLFVAGPPDLVDEEKVVRDPTGPGVQAKLAQQSAAWEGKRGSLLWAVSAAEGRKLAEYKLDSVPVFDGLAAAEGCLFLSMKDGKVVCFRGDD